WRLPLSSPVPPLPPISTLFPYTTLFRSEDQRRVQQRAGAVLAAQRAPHGEPAGQGLRGPERPQHADEPEGGVGFGHQCRGVAPRSEEHTSELQSRENLVCRLLLEKKKEK